MKAIVEIRHERPPHALIEELQAFNVDRVLSKTGRGPFALDVVRANVHRHVLKHGRLVVIGSTTEIMPYVGRITHLEENAGTGTVEVSGDNYASILYGMALNRTTPASGGAGRIAERLLIEAQGMGRSVFIQSAVKTGATLAGTINFGSQHLGAALDALAKRVDEEWWIEHLVTRRSVEHYLRWEHRRGTTRRDVVLTEGVHFTAVQYKTDALGAIRSATAVGGAGPIDARPSVVAATNPAQAARKAEQVHSATGPATSPLIARDVIEHRPLDTNPTVLADVARRAIERPTIASESMGFTITSDVWPYLHPGDTVRGRWFSVNNGLDRWVRISAMQPDESTGECDVALESAV
jgi:hypothetical protein